MHELLYEHSIKLFFVVFLLKEEDQIYIYGMVTIQ